MNTLERLNQAAYPVDYAEMVSEKFSITPDNFVAVKDTLYHIRGLSEGEFLEVLDQIWGGL